MRWVAAVAAAMLALAGCGKGTVYPKPIEEVRTTLAAAHLPPLVFGTVPPQLEMDTSDPTKVVWIVNKDGGEVLRFTAALTPEDAQSTRVAVDVSGPTAGAHGNVQKRLDENKAIKRLYLEAMEERVDSQLEGRPFDLSEIMGPLMSATAANMGKIKSDMEAAGAAAQRQDDENIRKAYEREAAGA